MRTSTFATIVAFLLPISVAFATRFPDVPSSHLYEEAIYTLQRLGIVQGSDDGNFYPEKELNRAEGLTLLFRAADIGVRDIYSKCFPDVVGEWYEETVCQAVHDGIVNGNPDGLFHGARIINNVEFLKILLNSLGFAVPNLTLENQVGIDFKNVNVKSWYAKYLFRAMEFELIPGELVQDNDFRPDGAVTRAQAAEMVNRALKVPIAKRTLVNGEQWQNSASARTSNPSEKITPTGAILVEFPIHRTGKTLERGSAAFMFNLEAPDTVLVETTNKTSASSGIDCFLYLLGESGFSSEFFVGYKENGVCSIRAALRAGRYQVEVRTRSEGAQFSLDVVPSTGDGNDGFIEAVALSIGQSKSDSLKANDFEDWYRFRVDAKATHRVKLDSAGSLSCSIYPSKEVDLFGFSGPVCNESYEFPSGTYYVSVKKTQNAAGSQAYTVELR